MVEHGWNESQYSVGRSRRTDCKMQATEGYLWSGLDATLGNSVTRVSKRVDQWVEHWPSKHEVLDLIPRTASFLQSLCLGGGKRRIRELQGYIPGSKSA